jgi:hypothetical protein
MIRTKNMELHEEDLQAVGEYVQAHLGQWLRKTETETFSFTAAAGLIIAVLKLT